MNTKLLLSGLALCLAFSLGAQTPDDSLAFVNAKWTVTELGKGATACTAEMEIFDSKQVVSVVKYKARRHKTVIAQGPDGKHGTTSELAKEVGGRYAVNGSYFNMRTLYPTTYTLVNGTLYGTTHESEEYRINGVVALKKRKVDVIACGAEEYDAIAKKHHSILAAGPMLMEDGKPYELRDDAFNNNRHPRTVFGTTRKGEVIMVVIDGRFPGTADGVSLKEATYIAHLLGMEDAINLDGGGSSAIWTAATGVLSHPSDNKLYDHAGERSVPNAVVVK